MVRPFEGAWQNRQKEKISGILNLFLQAVTSARQDAETRSSLSRHISAIVHLLSDTSLPALCMPLELALLVPVKVSLPFFLVLI